MSEMLLSFTDKSLSFCQTFLEQHFEKLRLARVESGNSIFALEHDLTSVQFEEIRTLLFNQSPSEETLRKYWLVWVVYSTEQGYNYIGEEYWQSFKENTPNWDPSLHEVIRWAFLNFQRKYNGIVPEGRWANHFSIISWPITHAFLPRYLQSHFARLLYSIRYKLRGSTYNDPAEVGRIMASNAGHITSNRFLNFLEHEELAGRVAIAMLKQSPRDNSFGVISEATLKRVVSDLEQKQNAKQWIRIAREEIETKFHGIEKLNQSVSVASGSSKRSHIRKPKLSLQRSNNKTWNLAIEFSDITSLFNGVEQVNFVRSTRFRINGTKAPWQPGERLITGSVRQSLMTWPISEQWLELEKNDSAFNLSSKFPIEASFPLVFIIDEDNGREVISKRVRPGEVYMLVFKGDDFQLDTIFEQASITCTPLSARVVKVPKYPSQDETESLLKLGISITTSVRVWPAGLSARDWDGEGYSEWLTTDTPMLGIVHDDSRINSYEVSLDTLRLSLLANGTGQPVFLKVPKLARGTYQLIVTPKGNGQFPSGEMKLNVREPIPWSTESIYQYTFAAFLDPFESDLDSFVSGNSTLQVVGPREKLFTIQVELFAGGKLLKSKTPKQFKIPFNNSEFIPSLNDLMKDQEFAVARNLRMTISAGNLGARVINLSRDIQPVRWLYSSKNSSEKLTLIDETDDKEKPTVTYYSVDDPMSPQLKPIKEFLDGNNLSDIKGLVRVNRKQFSESIIVSRLLTHKSLDGFTIKPRINSLKQNDIAGFSKCTASARMWYKAKCLSHVSSIHQQQICNAFLRTIVNYLCGYEWANAEQRFAEQPNLDTALISLSREIGKRSLSDMLLERFNSRTAATIRPDEEKAWFTNSIHGPQVASKSEAYFSIRVATNPFLFDEEFNGTYTRDLTEICRNPTLIKAARLYALGISRIREPEKNDFLIFPAGFKWS